ncbi:MAG: BamA/TamA family outer membrane protein [Acidobacteriota bacterium]|nr:BamA/TamA family outer membrane protein [Acidobacteriota bacterium]
MRLWIWFFFSAAGLVAQDVADNDVPTDAESAAEGVEKAGRLGKGSLVAVPIPFSNPLIGNGLAVMSAYLYKLNNTDQVSPASMTGLGAFYADSDSFGGGVGQKLYLREDRYRVTFGAGGAELYYDYFGIGNGAGDRGLSVPLVQQGLGGMAEIMFRLPADFFIGIRGKTAALEVGFDTEEIFPDLQIPIPELDSSVVAFSFRLQRDSRDDVYYPTGGSNLDLTGEFNDESWGSDFNYGRYELFFDYYRSMGKGVLALRGAGCYAEDGTPFFNLCLFGSNNDLRGYTGGRYRDHGMAAVQGEWRDKLYGSFGYAVFGGVGEIFPEWSDLNTDDLLPSYGVGLRWTVSPKYKMNIRVDYAWGKDEEHLYISLGEAF